MCIYVYVCLRERAYLSLHELVRFCRIIAHRSSKLLSSFGICCTTFESLILTWQHETASFISSFLAMHCNALYRTATHCNALQRTATHCNASQSITTHRNALQHTATHCSTLQRTATHCSTLQRTATQSVSSFAQ